MDTEFSNVIEILEKQSNACILITQVQIRGDNHNPEAVKIPGGISLVKENFFTWCLKEDNLMSREL